MARLKDRERALALRKGGKSYSQIRNETGVSKSTLSYWLRDFPLSADRIRELRDWNEQRIEKYRATRRINKENRLLSVYTEQKKILIPLRSRDLFLAGLFLYWGEGSKSRESRLSISNTNPAIIKFFKKWKKFRIHLQLYSDMDINREIEYWSRKIKIPRSQFIRPYIKKSSQNRINHKGGYGHGTCNLVVGDARIWERVMMSIRVIEDL